MGKISRNRIVEWAGSDAADASETRPKRRLVDGILALARVSGAASGAARAGAAILLASIVFIAIVGSIDRRDRPPVETVKMPNLVKNTRAAPEPKVETVSREATLRTHDGSDTWWLAPPIGLPQRFSEIGPWAPRDLCRRLADLGYSRARWNRSDVFPGEWECSSPLERTDTQARSFLLLRGSGEDGIASLMVKLMSPKDTERDALIGKAGEAVQAFSEATGLILSPEALPLLAGWQTGRTWTSQGTFRIVAEGRKETTRVLSLAVSPSLGRTAGDGCSQACRDRFAFLATKAVKERRVRSERRAAAPNGLRPQTGPAPLRAPSSLEP